MHNEKIMTEENSKNKSVISEREQENLKLLEENKYLEKKISSTYDMFYNSHTWKVGNILLKWPKKIKKLLEKGNQIHA